MNHHHFRLEFCHNKNIGLGKKSESKKSEPKPTKKTLLNFNQNCYLENRNQTQSEPKYFGYPNISEPDLYT